MITKEEILKKHYNHPLSKLEKEWIYNAMEDYKDVSISASQTKDERAAKAKKVYIGNGKTVWRSSPTPTAPVTPTNHNDDIPF